MKTAIATSLSCMMLGVLASGCASTRLYSETGLTSGDSGAAGARLEIHRAKGFVGGGCPLVVMLEQQELAPSRVDLQCFLRKGVSVKASKNKSLFRDGSGRRVTLAGDAWDAATNVVVSAPSDFQEYQMQSANRGIKVAQARNYNRQNTKGVYNASADALGSVLSAKLFPEHRSVEKQVFVDSYCEKVLRGKLVGQLGPGGTLSCRLAPGAYRLYAWADSPIDKNQVGWDNRQTSAPVDLQLRARSTASITLTPDFFGKDARIAATVSGVE